MCSFDIISEIKSYWGNIIGLDFNIKHETSLKNMAEKNTNKKKTLDKRFLPLSMHFSPTFFYEGCEEDNVLLEGKA